MGYINLVIFLLSIVLIIFVTLAFKIACSIFESTEAERIPQNDRWLNLSNQSTQIQHQNGEARNQNYELNNLNNNRERRNMRPVFLYPDQRLDRDLTRPIFSENENVDDFHLDTNEDQAGCSYNWQSNGRAHNLNSCATQFNIQENHRHYDRTNPPRGMLSMYSNCSSARSSTQHC